MNERKPKKLFYGIFSLLAALIGALLLYLGCRYNSDLRTIDNVYISLLLKNNLFSSITVGFLLTAPIVALSAALAYRKSAVSSVKNSTAATFARVSTGMFLLGVVVMQFVLDTAGTPYPLEGTSGKLQMVSLVFALLSALFFILPAFASRLSPNTVALCGLPVVCWLTVQLIVQHYFMLEFLSSPNRILPILSMVLLLLFMLTQLRFLRGRGNANWYIATGLAAFILSFSESLPRIILSLERQAGMKVDLFSFYALVRLAFGIYALACAVDAMSLAKRKDALTDTYCSETEETVELPEVQETETEEPTAEPSESIEPAELPEGFELTEEPAGSCEPSAETAEPAEEQDTENLE